MDYMENVINNITTVEGCMDYLRDMSMYKMMNDPNHRAMLFLMELLMNHAVPLTLGQLMSQINRMTANDDEIREICCGKSCSTTMLRTFLQKYPSLFHVNGEMVSAVDVEHDSAQSQSQIKHKTNSKDLSELNHHSMKNPGSTVKLRKHKDPQPSIQLDLSSETEAVKYFQSKLSTRWSVDRWIPIKSLAGHLSQAPDKVRLTVGPQTEFRSFLLRHPHVFELQGDLVGMRDEFPAICMRKIDRPRSMLISSDSVHQNKTQMAFKRRGSRPKSLIITEQESERIESDSNSSSNNNNNNNRIVITAKELKAAEFLLRVVQKRADCSMSLNHLLLHLTQAPPNIRDTIGWTLVELEEFCKKLPQLFQMDAHSQIIRCNTATTTGSCIDNEILIGEQLSDNNNNNDESLSTQSVDKGLRTIINKHGHVYHVTKLWGIIDLGQHEHVFFDRSIFRHLDDLQKHFRIGENLYFNAILAPKPSRAKWRATQVWKETDNDLVQRINSDLLSAPLNKVNLLNSNIDEIINNNNLSSSIQYDIQYDIHSLGHPKFYEYDEDLDSVCSQTQLMLMSEQRNVQNIDQQLAEIMQISKINMSDDEDDDEQEEAEAETEKHSNCSSYISSSSGIPGEPSNNSSGAGKNKVLVSVSTQTISTGEIMSINVFHAA